jgi:hypothetical protein
LDLLVALGEGICKTMDGIHNGVIVEQFTLCTIFFDMCHKELIDLPIILYKIGGELHGRMAGSYPKA